MHNLHISANKSQHIWQDFVAHFKSETTKASYQADIGEFIDYIKKDFTEATEQDVKKYFEFLQEKVKNQNIKPGTMAKKMRECHSFAEYICENKSHYHISHEYEDYFYPYLKQVARQEKHAASIPIEHIDRILQAAREDRMAYAILNLLYRTGLTSTEIIELQINDLEEFADGYYLWIKNRNEAAFLAEDVITILDYYLEERGDFDYFFYNRQGRKLNTMYISRMMKKYTALAGVPAYSAEMLRNSCACTMYAYGAVDKQVASQLGITQTQIRRYKNEHYKRNIQKQAQHLVKIKVEPPQ